MKFCKNCKKLYNGGEAVCTDCNKKYKEITDINEPVLLCVVGGVERSMINGALKDADIPFVEAPHGLQGVANEIVTGYDAKLNNIAVLVPYSAVPKAYDIAMSLEINVSYLEPLIETINMDIEKFKNSVQNDDENMSSAKRTTVKVLSALAFIILVALVVFGTDYVLELIKNLLGG